MGARRRNPKKLSKHEQLEQDLELLLATFCVEWGFCIPPAKATAIATRECISASEFAAEVLSAEGMIPEHHPDWLRRIKARFAARFGNSVSVDDYE